MNDRPSGTTNAHAAPPPYVPMSGGAVTALVLAIVLLFVSVIGPPWCGAIAFAIAASSLPAIRRRARRGKGVAIAAIVLACVGVGAGVMFQRAAVLELSAGFSPVVRALEKNDHAALLKTVPEGPDRDAKIERWTARAKAAIAAVGASTGDLTVPFAKWGFVHGIAATPAITEEFEPKGTDDPSAAFWFRLPCANGDVYVAFDFGTRANFSAALTKARSEASAVPPATSPDESTDTTFVGNAEDIRFFR